MRDLMVTMRKLTVRPRGSLLVGVKVKFYVNQEFSRRDQKEPHGENKRDLIVTMKDLTVRPRGFLMVGDM